MKLKVDFYPYGSNIHGFFVQRDNKEKTVEMTKKELFKVADLSHNVLTQKEYWDAITTNRDGSKRQQFEMLSNRHLLIVTRK